MVIQPEFSLPFYLYLVKDKLVKFLVHAWKLSKIEVLIEASKRFSLTEKILFGVLSIFVVFSFFNIGWSLLKKVMIQVPTYGGSISEGIIGTPRYINPVLAISDADRDLTTLIYSGLLKYTPNGDLINDLADDYTISDDKTTYTFTIREDAVFQDGTPVTASDIEYTIQKTLDPALKSPKLANWKGVQVKKIDERTIEFSLSQPYTPFLSNLTLGILPKHIWKDLSNEEFPFSQFNVEPVGSGPYKFSKVTRNKSGVPSYYTLTSFVDYTLGQPYINTFNVYFYSNEQKILDAYSNGEIESMTGVSPEAILDFEKEKSITFLRVPTSHIYGYFIDQSQNKALLNKEVRQALDMTLNRDRIVNESIQGFGESLNQPVPKDLFPGNYIVSPTNTTSSTKTNSIGTSTASTTEETLYWSASQVLEKAGWKKNATNGVYEKKDAKKNITPLTFSISTLNTPELRSEAQIAKESWEKLGAQVEIKLFDFGDLNQNVIRPRKYEVLLLGEVVGRDLDLYGYWHSSQRNSPGLNLSLYANSKVDKILEDMRKTSVRDDRLKKESDFLIEVAKDIPVVFSHTTKIGYFLPNKIKNFSPLLITTISERFLNVQNWYIETDYIWKVFKQDN